MMLPFAPVVTADMDTVKNLHFHEFAAYTDGVVRTIPVSQKKLQANTPYVVSTTGNLVSIIFRKGGTINTQKGGAYDPETGLYKKTLANGWSIYGTYEYKTWEEGDEGLGRTYGFAGLEGNDRWFDLQGRYLGNKKPSQKGA